MGELLGRGPTERQTDMHTHIQTHQYQDSAGPRGRVE